MPYNGKYYEAMQDGTVIDLFLKLLEVSNPENSGSIIDNNRYKDRENLE